MHLNKASLHETLMDKEGIKKINVEEVPALGK